MSALEDTTRIIGEVKAMIVEDAHNGVVPWTASAFSELHSYCDANTYLIDAGQVYDPDDQSTLDEINLIEDVVSRWLELGRLADMQPVRVTWLVTERYALELPAEEWRDRIGIPAGKRITVDDIPVDYLAETEGSDMYVGTEDRSVDNVEAEGQKA